MFIYASSDSLNKKSSNFFLVNRIVKQCYTLNRRQKIYFTVISFLFFNNKIIIHLPSIQILIYFSSLCRKCDSPGPGGLEVSFTNGGIDDSRLFVQIRSRHQSQS